ncbi:hypothetical protein ACFY1P_20040 [Streptomyces sp. NPDC001407]|uniref:hypothetical protein n=1 Tax=Streptomyces sp. NPDC001407 TaxID=3364573 RepID=UPI0036A05037
MSTSTIEPVPFDGDQGRWSGALRETARRYHDAAVELVVRPAQQPALRSVVDALRLIPERTRYGWLRWEALPTTAEAGGEVPGLVREAGVLDPGQGSAGRWACRAVWGRRPPLYILSLAGVDVPRPIPATRATVFTLAAFAALVPVTAVLPGVAGLLAAALAGAAVAQGIPAGLRRATRRRVRIVGDGAAYAMVFFRLLAYEQQLRALAQRSGRGEVDRAAALVPQLLWDAAGLVPLAEDDEQARELLLGYEESLAALVGQALEVEREDAAVESAILDDPSPATAVPLTALPDGLLSLDALEEARREMGELQQGLRHARHVLGGEDDGESSKERAEDGHAR